MRRSEPLHTSAFLVHQDWCVAPDDLPKRIGQRSHLARISDIALEQDHAERRGVTQELPLAIRDRHAGQADNECAGRHRRGLARAGNERQDGDD
jgi:hypothetical protein